jgi:hypothetical protein
MPSHIQLATCELVLAVPGTIIATGYEQISVTADMHIIAACRQPVACVDSRIIDSMCFEKFEARAGHARRKNCRADGHQRNGPKSSTTYISTLLDWQSAGFGSELSLCEAG